MTATQTIAIYARYSSDLQSERSIDDQARACEDFAARIGLGGPFAIFTDAALSGASMAQREGLKALLEAVRGRRVSAIVAEAIDRLSRDQADLHLIRRAAAANGVKLYTIADGEVDAMKAGLQGIMAEAFLVNLAQKTRRGMIGVARQGRIAGGLAYGYRAIDGKPGERVIDAAEAAIVTRIFTEYAEGRSPFAIARGLNGEGVAGPRGRAWKVNAILGDARVGDGVLCNELYRGRVVFNRRRFVKNAETGRRAGFLNPPSDWIVVEAPELRIIDDALWGRVQSARGAISALPRQNDRHRAKRLLSGLLRCAACGGAFNIVNRDRVACANAVGGTCSCSVRERAPAPLVERRVIEGIKACLLAPEMIGEAVRAFHAERARTAAESDAQRRRAETGLAEARRRADRIAEQLIEGPSPLLRAKLAEAEAQIQRLERELALLPATSVVALHPGAAEAYRRRVAVLDQALAAGAAPEIATAVRGLLDRVELAPDAQAPDGWRITVHGDLAALLALGAGQTKGPAVASGALCTASLGAGVGFEPTTFRL